MIDDFAGGRRRKPKVIEPLPKEPSTPLPDLNGEDFKTPDEIAAEEAIDQTELPTDPAKATNGMKKKFTWPYGKKTTIIIGVALFILIVGGGTLSYILTKPSVQGGRYKDGKVVYVPPKPVTVASKLTGLQVNPEVNKRPVTGVMIENSLDARPQSGLDQAGVVFEAIAEGGITRFLALYQDTQPDYIGPVRSARPYYVQWCMGFDCSLAHVGGSPEALKNIRDWRTKDLDQFFNAGAYHRISSRYAPHNVYTSASELNKLESNKGFGASDYTGFERKKDAPSATPNAASIDLNISGYYYNVHYDYDAASNSYLRSEGGKPHMSLHKDGNQARLNPKVIVAMVMQYGLEADDHHSFYNVIGSGQAYIFQDGTATTGTWAKADRSGSLTFTDANGQPIKLNAGQTWLTALSAANQVSYK